jgi:biopolymer transport protein ExbD
MSRKFKLKKRSKGPEGPVEINVTPMIDMFSVLNSFLLMAAVFSASGLVRVEIPFLSSKPPPTQEEVDKNPQKVLTVVVDNDAVVLDVSQTNTSQGPQKDKFDLNPQGLDKLQEKIYEMRLADKRIDKVTIMTELDVPYEKLVMVLDSLRVLAPGRPPIPLAADYKIPFGVDRNALIPKIVLGNIIL